MPQFLADFNNDNFILDKQEARHLGVLRFAIGQEVKLFDGKGTQYIGKLEYIDKNSAGGTIINKINTKQIDIDITLCFCVVSRTATEEILDSCTQLGVQKFQPIISDFTEKDLLKKWDTKKDRWTQIILSACKQSCRPTIPQILEPISFKDSLKNTPAIFCYEAENNFTISQALEKLNYPKSLFLHIGPEGGYSKEEATKALKAGFVSVTLGPNILRAQTACIAAIAKVLK